MRWGSRRSSWWKGQVSQPRSEVLRGIWKQQVLEYVCLDTCEHATWPTLWVGEKIVQNISLEGDLQRSVKSVGTQWCSVFTPVAMFRQTLCCMSPYSRSGRSQKKKFCFFHSALKEGPLAEPNISSRTACDKINRYAIYIIGKEGGRDSHKAGYNMLLDHT